MITKSGRNYYVGKCQHCKQIVQSEQGYLYTMDKRYFARFKLLQRVFIIICPDCYIPNARLGEAPLELGRFEMSESMWSESESEIKLFRFFHQFKPIYITKRIATTQNFHTNWFYFTDKKINDTDILFKEPLTDQIAELIIKKTPVAYETIEYKDKARRKKEIVSSKILARKAYADLIKPYITFDSITPV